MASISLPENFDLKVAEKLRNLVSVKETIFKLSIC